MSNTTKEQARVAERLAAALGVDVRPSRLPLGEWGHSDGRCLLASGWHLVVEAENAQAHPCTNVAKLWPWLEGHPTERVVLVHVYFSGVDGTHRSKGIESSRGRIGRWLGSRMERELAGRFQYRRIVDLDPKALSELRELIERLPQANTPIAP